jgi:hypothetical protein
MQNGITLGEYYNSLSDKAVDLALFVQEGQAILQAELSTSEKQEAAILAQKNNQKSESIQAANSGPFLPITHEMYIDIDKDQSSGDTALTFTKETFVKASSMSYGTDLTKKFTGVHEKMLRADIKAWNHTEDQSPKIKSGQYVKFSDYLSM